MAIIKDINGRLVDIEPLVCYTESYFWNKLHTELKEKEHVQTATTTAHFDGDILKITRYPFIVQDQVKMMEKIFGNKKCEKVGKMSNLATKCMKFNWIAAQIRKVISKHNPNMTIDLWKE